MAVTEKDAGTEALKRGARRTALLSPRYAGVGALILVIIVLQFFFTNNFHYDVAIKIGLSAIVCVGLNLLIGYAGQISLGHAGFFGLGAYSSAILTDSYGWPPLASLFAGLVLVGVLSFVLARPILRLKGHYLAMATLGMGIIISIVLNQEVDLTGGPDGMPVPAFSLFGWSPNSEPAWYWLVSGVLVVTVWLSLNLIDSSIGRALRAVHGSEVAAETVGVDTTRYKVLIFVVSALFASLAGSLFAHYTGFLTPVVAEFFTSIQFVIMVVFGGMASVFGSVVGAAVLTALPEFLTVLHDYEHLVFGLLLMLTMIFMSKGLLPSLIILIRRRLP
ncbi:MAG: branched-chain amino acid ABC transporter permease [Alphaproteobacteria bacterium]|nr:branched-chain amino acid ABC transporter permease [Alphaproteobacteria bacterium]